jgi:hypothetical protein
MATFKIWHGEFSSRADANTQEAAAVEAVAATALFRYYEGDCDTGADCVKKVAEDMWIASRKNSPDYFFIVKETRSGH